MALVAACGTAPTSAPVIERSPNANAAAATGAPVTPVPASTSAKPQPPAPTNPQVAVVPSDSSPKPEKPATPEIEKFPTAIESPTKPYREGDWRPEYHVVRKGDTLYSIALDYGQDYRELAAWNNLEDPALIKIDQRLRLFPPSSVGETTAGQRNALPAVATTPVFSEPKARKLPYSEQALAQLKMPTAKIEATTAPLPAAAQTQGKSAPNRTTPPPSAPVQKEIPGTDVKMSWEWPAQGRLLYGFGQGSNQKGVGIEGRSGQPVLAAAPGKVVYSGSGLRGYGKLIIIKHNASYLSVYAHNSQILVKEGQTVAKGQKIGEIGNSDSDRLALHFEIRRLGKPIDPLQYLPERAS